MCQGGWRGEGVCEVGIEGKACENGGGGLVWEGRV